jgi:hypothetical protein
MPLFRKLATLATVAEAARRYAKSNPDQAAKYLDQAAKFVDRQTKGKYSGQISGAAQKVKSVAGIRQTPRAAGNGYTPGYDQNGGFGRTTGHTNPQQPQPGQSYPGAPER